MKYYNNHKNTKYIYWILIPFQFHFTMREKVSVGSIKQFSICLCRLLSSITCEKRFLFYIKYQIICKHILGSGGGMPNLWILFARYNFLLAYHMLDSFAALILARKREGTCGSDLNIFSSFPCDSFSFVSFQRAHIHSLTAAIFGAFRWLPWR
jgi:hypothetical protein